MTKVTAEYVRSLLHYCPGTGQFFWKKRQLSSFRSPRHGKTWNTRFAGQTAGSAHDGYRIIVIAGRMYRAHRLAWLIETGEWPAAEIDHQDLNRANNAWGNLREATPSQNKWNTSKRRSNSSGFKGVYWCKNTSKWRAKISAAGKSKHLGLFASPELAFEAYRSASNNIHHQYGRVA